MLAVTAALLAPASKVKVLRLKNRLSRRYDAEPDSASSSSASVTSVGRVANANLAAVFASGSADAERRIGGTAPEASSSDACAETPLRSAPRAAASSFPNPFCFVIPPTAMTRTSSSSTQGFRVTTPSAQAAPSSGVS